MITNKIEFNLVLTKISFVDYKDLYLLIIFSQLGMQILMVFGGDIYSCFSKSDLWNYKRLTAFHLFLFSFMTRFAYSFSYSEFTH